MNAELRRLVDGVTAALARHVVPGQGLLDPHVGKATPPDHYGQTAAALALSLSPAGRPAAYSALHAWLAQEPRHLGHLPFNRLLLALLGKVLAASSDTRDKLEDVRNGLARCTLASRYPSNNWSLLAQCCRLVEGTQDRRAEVSARYCAMLARWTTKAGAFIDFPEAPGPCISTPTAYHHKALFLTALAAWFHDDPKLARQAQRLLDWLVHCWDPAGYAGGLGRSNHALFGDGCLLAAMVLLGLDGDSSPVTALTRRLEHQRRPDGLLWLAPSDALAPAASWDGYMHLSVYNAWFAAVVAVAGFLRSQCPPPASLESVAWNGARPGWFYDAEAGIGCLRDPRGTTAIVTTRGQPPQAFSRNEVDFRYVGGTVLHFSDGRGRLFVPAPIRAAVPRLLAHPALAAWTPVFLVEDRLYGLTDFEDVMVEEDHDAVSITLRGNPVALTRGTAETLPQKLLSALDWRFLGGRLGRNSSLRRATLPSIVSVVRIDVRAGAAPRLAVRTEISVSSTACRVRYLNARGHALIAPAAHADTSAISLPSSLPDAAASCLPAQDLAPGDHAWGFEIDFLDAPSDPNRDSTSRREARPPETQGTPCSP